MPNKTKSPAMECPTCDGSGTVPLSGVLLITYQSLRTRGPSSPVELWANLKSRLAVTAINNRLERLREFGLVRRQRVGKEFVYSVV